MYSLTAQFGRWSLIHKCLAVSVFFKTAQKVTQTVLRRNFEICPPPQILWASWLLSTNREFDNLKQAKWEKLLTLGMGTWSLFTILGNWEEMVMTSRLRSWQNLKFSKQLSNIPPSHSPLKRWFVKVCLLWIGMWSFWMSRPKLSEECWQNSSKWSLYLESQDESSMMNLESCTQDVSFPTPLPKLIHRLTHCAIGEAQPWIPCCFCCLARHLHRRPSRVWAPHSWNSSEQCWNIPPLPKSYQHFNSSP